MSHSYRYLQGKYQLETELQKALNGFPRKVPSNRLKSWFFQIWRCPDFKLLACKDPPKQCTSYRMIYIRHGHMECPACLICAVALQPWAVLQSTSPIKESKPKRTKRKVNQYSKFKVALQGELKYQYCLSFHHKLAIVSVLGPYGPPYPNLHAGISHQLRIAIPMAEIKEGRLCPCVTYGTQIYHQKYTRKQCLCHICGKGSRILFEDRGLAIPWMCYMS